MFCKVFGPYDKQLLVRKTFNHDKDEENPYQIMFEIFLQITVTLVLEFETIQARDASFDAFGSDEEYEETYKMLETKSEPYRTPKRLIN